MRRIQLTEDTFEDTVSEASEVVVGGGVVLCPTDTCYILVADALNQEAIEQVFQIKGRPAEKPVHVIVYDLTMAERFVASTPTAAALAHRLLPGPLTLILPKLPKIPNSLTSGRTTLGVRIPAHKFSRELSRVTGKPITATSANQSGGTAPLTIEDAIRSLGRNSKLVKLAIDEGRLDSGAVSTILDLSAAIPRILRRGAMDPRTLAEVIPSLRLD